MRDEERAAQALLLTCPNAPPNIRQFLPEQVGWKRRTDMERHTKGTVWELPAGRIYIAPPGPVYIQVLYGED